MYVDDLFITGNNNDHIFQVKQELQIGFEMIDLGLLHYYLGVEVKQREGIIFISQAKYIFGLLKKFGMEECKPTITPMEQKLNFLSLKGGSL